MDKPTRPVISLNAHRKYPYAARYIQASKNAGMSDEGIDYEITNLNIASCCEDPPTVGEKLGTSFLLSMTPLGPIGALMGYFGNRDNCSPESRAAEARYKNFASKIEL